MKNIFRELNVKEDFSKEEVKESYFNLMKKYYDELSIDDSVLFLAQKRIDRVDEAFEMISSIKDFDYLEDKYDVLYNICEEFKKKKNYKKALLISNELIDFIPIFPDSYLLKADILAKINEHEEAIKYFEIAEEMEYEIKEDQYIQYHKSQSQIEAKKYEDAIKTLKKITKLYGDNPFFFFDIACCYKELGDEEMYKHYCEKRDKYWREHEND
ncbi:tetratricopeptide repeat protein [Terrisporobacter vanillatitrophus]